MPKLPEAVLWIRGGPDDGSFISLSQAAILMGRDPTSDVVVEGDGVSRQHAMIRTDPNGYWIQDLGSRNGTFVNGAQVEGEGVQLRDTDLVQLGGSDVEWVFRERAATVGFTRPSL